MIEPRVLKGFRDSLPQEEILKREFISKIESSLQKRGFVPIDTPALEYYEILTGKGGEETDKQIFNFVDSGGRKVGLRFDLTVPLARFVALHENEIIFPFKRYHISKVWRGEKPQKGRFREFIQADFDIIGANGLTSDIEIIETIIELLSSLNIKNFVVHINDRALLKEIFKKIGIQDLELQILKILDKYYKTSEEWVLSNVMELLLEKSNFDNLRNIVKNSNNIWKENNNDKNNNDKNNINKNNVDKNNVKDYLIKNARILIDLLINTKDDTLFFEKLSNYFRIGESKLQKIYNHFDLRGLSSNIKIDGSITRGLDYYTGIVFETFIEDHKEYGAICSGGRYDNLTSVFSKNVYSGIGSSIGIDRLISYLLDSNLLKSKSTLTDVLIINFSENDLPLYYDISDILKKENINTEIYSENVRLKKQFKYADRKKIKFCLIMGEEEIKNKVFKLKEMVNSKEFVFNDIEKLINYINENKYQ